MEIICETGYRSNSYFYHDGTSGYAYHYSDHRGETLYFKCMHSYCSGRAIFREGSFQQSQPHNHPSDPDLLQEREFRRCVLSQCRNVRSLKQKQVWEKERANLKYSARVRSKMTLNRLRTAMRNARRNRYPNVPKTLKGLTKILLKKKYCHVSATLDDLDNLYAGSVTATDGSHHVIFISKRMQKVMSEVEVIHADGTFKARPAVPPSSQLFVLTTSWRHTMVPLCWVLMERRTIPAYRAILQYLQHKLPENKIALVTTDFEWAQQRAWQMEFPRAKLRGCLWHLCQAFVKKCLKLQLKRYFKVLPAMLPAIRKTCAIALLPRKYFALGLQELRKQIRNEDIVTAYLLEPLFDYVKNRWINNYFRNQWMCCYKSVYRTNNSSESHHRLLRSQTGAHRPNVYHFIDALAQLESNAFLDSECLDVGETPARTRRWTAVANDRIMKALRNDFKNQVGTRKKRAIVNYLNRAAHIMHRAIGNFIAPAPQQQQ